MHPPFGFAQFYFRSIAPKEVKSNDIYLGAIPWVFMQLILAAVLIFYPGRVTMWLDKDVKHDLDKIKIELPTDDPAAKQPATQPAGGVPATTAPRAAPADKAAEAEKDLGKLFGGPEKK